MVATLPLDSLHLSNNLSVPFSSGQWLLLHARNDYLADMYTFSPLFIGAMVATRRALLADGQRPVFQSPFHRGNGCYSILKFDVLTSREPFSPLFIGAMVAT